MKARAKGINLLPNEYIIAEKIRFYQMIASIVLLVEVVGFVNFIVLPPKREVKETQHLLLQKQEELSSSRYAGVNKTLNDLEVAKTDMKKWLNKYSSLKQEGYINGKLFDEFVTRLPEGVNITSFNIDVPAPAADGSSEKTIVIECQSNELQESINYVTILEALYPSDSITHDIAYDKQEHKYKGVITIKLKIAAIQPTTTSTAEATPVEEGTAPATTEATPNSEEANN